MSSTVTERVRAAGIVGAGGAGFPTHVKLGAKVDRVLANGASCEPLLMSDPWLMEQEAAEVIRGLTAVIDVAGATKGTVCLKGKHTKAMAAVKEAVRKYGNGNIDVFELGDFYPAGDEQILVYEVMNRVVPEGGLPLMVGAVVSNVESLYNVAQALDGKPVTDRFLTVTGEVNRPAVMKVPVGMTVGDVINAAGGPVVNDYKTVIGGPMMGTVVSDMDTPVTKTTSGVIVLPSDHNVVTGKIKDPDRIRYITRMACCQCSRCTDMCPRYLLGHSLEPHKIMRRLGSLMGPFEEVMADALICSECGICEKFACPMMISPREVNARLKKELLAEGVKRPPKRDEYRPSAFRRLRRIPTGRLIERLRLGKYHRHPGFLDNVPAPDRVVVPLIQHIGAPARPTVKAGDTVKKGDLIGDIPEKALGARIHASIDGRIESVGDSVIIKRGSQV